MDVFQAYKPIRNKIASLAIDDSLAVIWAYCQFLQIDGFKFPAEIEVERKFLSLDVPQQWISEWTLELLAKEVILNGNYVSSKDRTLRTWNTLSEFINLLMRFENSIYGHFGSDQKILLELARIAHRQFIWQGNPPNAASIIRYFKIFNRPAIDEICSEQLGLNIWETFMCGVACMGFFLDRPAMNVPFKSEIKALAPETIERFLSFCCKDLSELKPLLKSEQSYDENFAYAYNSLRAYPLVRTVYRGQDAIICPLPTLLYWRFTAGLYYQLIGDDRFPNEFGSSFQSYVGEVIKSACTSSNLRSLPEEEYSVGKLKKRSTDWIVADEKSALFLECKAKRLSWGAKAFLNNLQPLDADIENMASAVVQVYRTIIDYKKGYYRHLPPTDERRIYPAVVTLENWRFFGPIMLGKLNDAVVDKLIASELPPELLQQMPYSVWAIEELEVGLQIMNSVSISDFIGGKLDSQEMRSWDWHAYMTKAFPKHFPAKRLFDAEYDEMFAKVYAAQQER
jgi:hypothetical protein